MRYVLMLAFVAIAEIFMVWRFTAAIGVGSTVVLACFEALGTTLLGTVGVIVLMYELALWLFPHEQHVVDWEPPARQIRNMGG
jgi:hypothetical protein